MREIKFRGYSKKHNRWFYGGFVKNISGDCFIINEERIFSGFYYENTQFPLFSEFIYEVEPESVGQFTGLTDANDEPIYEGDIVKQLFSGKIYIVSYNHNWAGFEPFFGGYEKHKAYEIIGNIYENPELLQDKINKEKGE
jgi:uncharacterized phage protein (TIGR01671 family)